MLEETFFEELGAVVAMDRGQIIGTIKVDDLHGFS